MFVFAAELLAAGQNLEQQCRDVGGHDHRLLQPDGCDGGSGERLDDFVSLAQDRPADDVDVAHLGAVTVSDGVDALDQMHINSLHVFRPPVFLGIQFDDCIVSQYFAFVNQPTKNDPEFLQSHFYYFVILNKVKNPDPHRVTS